ncbi:sigma-70 family RNA polymerase sigma factor [soil metagenome]
MSIRSDQELLSEMADGDELAFAAIYNRHKEAVYAFCVKMLQDRVMAQDVLQDVFLKAFQRREQLCEVESLKAWLLRVARNRCLNLLRDNRRTSRLTETDGAIMASSRPTPLAEMERSEQVALLNECLLALSPPYREVIVLREYQNLAYEDIAEVTDTTVSSVKSRLFKARRKLAELLAPYATWHDSTEAKSEPSRPTAAPAPKK